MAAVTYKKAGVDINKADEFIQRIKPLLERTRRDEVLGKIGGFSGLFMPRLKDIKNPVLVSAADGVGTKILVADLVKRYNSLGVDLVAMCADDVIVTGAEPLFFLDYISSGKLNTRILLELIKGMVKGCQDAGCALIGGETAELPGMYEDDKFDLAGFCVGIVSRENIIDGSYCRKGDRVVGLASSGLHSNGFSLVRKIFSVKELRGKLGLELLKPTRIYARLILRVMEKVRIKAIAHITGGGFYGNIPRVLPEGLGVKIEKGAWTVPAVFRKIKEKGQIEEKEMFRTFNMGVGMALIVGSGSAERVVSMFEKMGLEAWIIGNVVEGKREVVID